MYNNLTIDAHLHVNRNGSWFSKDLDASHKALMKQMEAVGVNIGIILCIVQLDQNDYVRSICEKSDGKLFALAGFDPLNHDIATLREYLSLDVFKGVKLHPRREDFSPLDERIFPFYEEASKKGWVINFDALGHSEKLPIEEIRPARFDRLAKKFPELKMILSHCAAPWVMEAFFTAKSNKNVYLDCSLILDRYKPSSIYTDLMYTAMHLDSKLIYGSDFPERPVNRYLSLARIELNNLPEDKRANIFGLNAQRLFDLK